MRASIVRTCFSTSYGEGKCLSSGPWLWIATLMSYCLANRSMRGRIGGSVVATMTGIPAAFAYSKYFRTPSSLSSSKVIVPPPTICRPEASISRRAAASSSGGSS